MSLTTACIRGKMGDIEYFQTTMTAQEAASSLRAASENRDNWLSLGIEERFQREINERRVRNEIAPYFATDNHRFISSILVLVKDPQEFGFESLESVIPGVLPFAYRGATSNMGFLTVAGGENVILDGQHRHAGIKMAIQADFETLDRWMEQQGEEGYQRINDDDISVLFINIDDNEVIRKIFNKINKHAKKTSTADDIITNMDDGAAFVTRALMEPSGLLGDRYTGARQSKSMINWKSNTVSSNSKCLTHLSSFHALNTLILKSTGSSEIVGTSLKPSQSGINDGIETCKEWWSKLLNGISEYKQTLEGTADGVSPVMRTPESTFQLLFLPVGQWAMVKALTIVRDRGQDLDQAIARLNLINFSSNNELWTDIAFKTDGKVMRNSNYKNMTAEMIAYLIGSEFMEDESKNALLTKLKDFKNNSEIDLPEPVLN